MPSKTATITTATFDAIMPVTPKVGNIFFDGVERD